MHDDRGGDSYVLEAAILLLALSICFGIYANWSVIVFKQQISKRRVAFLALTIFDAFIAYAVISLPLTLFVAESRRAFAIVSSIGEVGSVAALWLSCLIDLLAPRSWLRASAVLLVAYWLAFGSFSLFL